MSKLKEKLADMLFQAEPDFAFDARDIKRNYDGGTRATEALIGLLKAKCTLPF